MIVDLSNRYRDPEIEQYEVTAETSEQIEKPKSSTCRDSSRQEAENSNGKASATTHTLERALIDIRECIIKTMGPRKHPPKTSRAQPLDESAVLAYKEEIMVEVMQRKSSAAAIEDKLNNAVSRREGEIL